MSLAQRVEALERIVATQSQILQKIQQIQTIEDFVPISIAVRSLNVSASSLRQKINDARAFPKESPYKEGIHWKRNSCGKNYRYLINIREWGRI